ncbi:cytochrome c oxidase subunit 3 [Mycobacterium xenopi]|uniref:Probable cytochrome c oxidase subunit 3 n=1 Tax=Mycobacterium xenopi TaxID=1789 RepID=A0AAD1LZX3_MYCXE|nr:cytochrome c oxidase subunit 3 [Mycobacterium xenopi]EUA51152.1 cytochrome c oxidase subunit III family protein [Mycobacterium xenopi 3993]MDA3641880.1 cytochrome c oxidase subunit 3 [Mycobacterium xenopi]MDA3658744.1 cytochrome c oxidase subunit 3 [Mycobacterium xenopi]MDA3664153.1 cytochrome c oxidase subunit 3 [Mycobacterium xenopi]ORX19687.1 hypothetical protein AWC32_09065 [Mycobacterium xenopi]
MTAAPTAGMRQHKVSPPRIPGEPDAWVFIIGEMIIFTALFGLIGYNRGKNPGLFAAGQRELAQGLGLTNTIVLLTGSILVVLATQAVADRRFDTASPLIASVIGCGLTFASVKAIEYWSLFHDGITIHTNRFWMLFFVITGAHLVHVAVASAGLVLLRSRVRLGLPGPREPALFESGACYWHMVDLIWLILFPLFYLVN